MDLFEEIKKFREWAAKTYPPYACYGEWECDYEHWTDIYDSLPPVLSRDPLSLSEQQVDDILYILGRDNEVEIIEKELAEIPEMALFLAKKAAGTLHSWAKWQLAKVIAAYTDEGIDKLIFDLSLDRDYYVQRICMMESAQRKSPYTRQMIDWSWDTYDEYQRISALWSLHWIKDPELKFFLASAKKSGLEQLVKVAEEIEREFVEIRLRNGVIEYFDLISAKSAVLSYQKKVPQFNISNEIINQWQDYAVEPVFSELNYPKSIYTEEERNAMKDFHKTWESVANDFPYHLPTEEVVETKKYEELASAARLALVVFMKRGKLEED